jgi:phosphoglycerate dehydrogenase-like enzyme
MSESNPLIVGVLFPEDFDPVAFARRVGDLARPLDIRKGFYFDTESVRIWKRHNHPIDEIRAQQPPLSPETESALSEAEVILAVDVPIDIATLAPRLKWLQTYGAGIRQFNERSLFDKGVLISTAAGVGAEPIAEFVIGRLLEITRRFRVLEEMQRTKVWQRLSGAEILAGKTLGILGLGAIGKAVAQRARAMDMRVMGTRKRYQPGDEMDFVDQLLGSDGADQVLRESDVVVLALPETAETENMISSAQIAMMKPGAILCNVARGSILDEEALVAALESGHLAAAIVDVQRHEPMEKDDPLWEAPNIYLSPHSAATAGAYGERVERLFTENLRQYVSQGKPSINVVDPDAGY